MEGYGVWRAGELVAWFDDKHDADDYRMTLGRRRIIATVRPTCVSVA